MAICATQCLSSFCVLMPSLPFLRSLSPFHTQCLPADLLPHVHLTRSPIHFLSSPCPLLLQGSRLAGRKHHTPVCLPFYLPLAAILSSISLFSGPPSAPQHLQGLTYHGRVWAPTLGPLAPCDPLSQSLHPAIHPSLSLSPYSHPPQPSRLDPLIRSDPLLLIWPLLPYNSFPVPCCSSHSHPGVNYPGSHRGRIFRVKMQTCGIHL